MSNMGKLMSLFLIVSLLSLGVAHARLVVYYPFDGNIDDASGNGKTGVYWSAGGSTATPTFVTGAKPESGQAISLRAFDSYDSAGVGGTRIYQGVILPDESFFDFDKEITLSLWCKFNSPMLVYSGGDCQGAWAALLQRSRTSGHWCLQTNWNTTSPAQRLSFRIAHPATTTSTMSVRPGTTDVAKHLSMDPSDWVTPNWDLWYHVVTTYDSTGLATIYLDSAFNRSQQDTGTDKSIVDKGDGGYNLAVGIGIYANSDYTPGGTGTSSDYSHDGLIDEVAIFDHVLSPRAIAMLYQNSTLCLIDEPGGSTAVDEKGVVASTTDEYQILFIRPPSHPVTITVGGYDTDQISVSPSAMVVSSMPWEYNFTVTALDDPAIEGFQTTGITHTVASADPCFNWGYDPNYLPDVVVNIYEYESGTMISNGGFELPDVEDSPPYWMASPTAWQTEGAGGVCQWDSSPGDNQVLFSLGRCGFYQDTGFTFLGGKTYVLSADIGQFPNTSSCNYTLQLRDAESDTVWAEADQDDFGHPGAGAFDLTGTLSYTTPASGGPVGKQIRIYLVLGYSGVSFDNVALYLVNDPVNLTMAVSPSDKGINTCYPPVGQTVFMNDSYVAIKADTYYGWPQVYKFDHWVGQGVTDPNSSHTTVLMDQNRSVNAVYIDDRAGNPQWHALPAGDINQDSFMDMWDLVFYVENWLENNNQ